MTNRRNGQILLIIEDQTLADVTAFRLELVGFAVHTVHSGESGLEAVGRSIPDLVIVDLVLPGISGLELIERGGDERTYKVPIIALSIDADLSAVQRAYLAGASDYLVAPYDPIVLQDKVEKLMAVSDPLV